MRCLRKDGDAGEDRHRGKETAKVGITGGDQQRKQREENVRETGRER